MRTWDVRILSASYCRDGDGVVIELFGKTRDRKSITILYYGFKPYIYVVNPEPNLASLMLTDKDVISVSSDKLFYKGETKNVLKVTVRYPWLVPDYRNRLKKYDLLAADIVFHHRFIYDMNMGACIRVTGEEIEKNYNTHFVVQMESFENIDSFDPGLKFLAFDIENSILHESIFTICSVTYDNGEIKTCEPVTGSETDIIKKFSEIIIKEDPDVITGYNIDNYDIKKICDRAKFLGVLDEVKWGRDGGIPKFSNEIFWRVKGRLIVDAWKSVRKELKLKQETLNAVSMQILGESKMDVDPKHIDDEWANDKNKVIKYCIKDAELSLKILLRIGSVRKGIDLSTVSMLPLEDVLTSGTSTLVDSLLIRKADKDKIGVPMTRKVVGMKQIEGGYVHTMVPGIYHWVCVLDFKSMYPSLIIAKNICFTTLAEDGEIISPNGVRYMSKERRVGLLPTILKDLMKERDEIKIKMKETKIESEYHYLDGLQSAMKVLMNTFYGVFASSFYRFTDRNIGSSITSFARSTITGIINEVQSENISVVYSDTDSIFVQSPADDLNSSINFGNKMARRFSTDGGTLEFEKILEPLFTHGKKKRYVGKVVWPEAKDELLVRGYEIRRSDSFDLQSNLLTKLFNFILQEKTNEALLLVKETVQRVLSGNIPISELVISKGCKGPNAYENPDSMASVQAAKKLMDMGHEFIPGMKVSWVVTNSKSTPQTVEPYVSGVAFKGKPDYKYYAERIAQTSSRITEVFGWNEKDIMMSSQQFTLLDDTFSKRERLDKKPIKETPKIKCLKLTDFL
ncbi:MAG: DNA polymerase II [archaeon]|nr:DNA polymerase II [archaeon]